MVKKKHYFTLPLRYFGKKKIHLRLFLPSLSIINSARITFLTSYYTYYTLQFLKLQIAKKCI